MPVDMGTCPVLVTRRRMGTILLSLFALVRCVHLGQAVIDVAVGARVYTQPLLAATWAAACVAESGVLLGWSWRRRRLELTAMLADAVFGLGGLGVLSVAMAGTLGRLDTLNWMLPYTVGTSIGLGFALASTEEDGHPIEPAGAGEPAQRGAGPAHGIGDGRRGALPPRWIRDLIDRRLVAVAVTVALLAAGYLASVLLPQRLLDETTHDLMQNLANYPLFLLVSLMLTVVARRRVATVEALTKEAEELAARTGREATAVSLTKEYFNPVVDVMKRVADDPATAVLLREAAKELLNRIDDLALATSIDHGSSHD